MDLNAAIDKHAAWKTKFRSAIAKKEKLDAETIAKDNCCELGKWLHGDAKSTLARYPALDETVKKHAVFHQEAAKVARSINAGDYGGAEAMLNQGSSYANASSAVGVAILKLKKEAAL